MRTQAEVGERVHESFLGIGTQKRQGAVTLDRVAVTHAGWEEIVLPSLRLPRPIAHHEPSIWSVVPYADLARHTPWSSRRPYGVPSGVIYRTYSSRRSFSRIQVIRQDLRGLDPARRDSCDRVRLFRAAPRSRQGCSIRRQSAAV